MLKKIFAIFIITALTAPITSAKVGQPTFVFAIDDNPAAASNTNKDEGLSGGAVTAITLGSIGGAAILGLAGWLYKRKIEQNLAAGCIRGTMGPLVPFCIDQNPNSEFYARINKNYPYLQKALSLNEIHYCPASKYLLVYDTKIEKRTFDSVKFSIPEGVKSIKITHVTDSFKQGEIATELFLNQKPSSSNKQAAPDILKNIENERPDMEGVIMKTVSVNTLNYDSGIYVITNYSGQKIYGIVFEFIF